MTKKYDKGRAVHVVYTGFSKAFDKDPHGRLLWKFRSQVIQEMAEWIEHWLHGRNQRVMVDGCFSDWRPVTSGASGYGAGPFAVCHLYQ